MSAPPLLLVDGDNALHRAYHVMVDLQTSTGLRVGGVTGMLSIVRWLVRDYPDHVVVVVWDGGRSDRRKRACPTYKQGRVQKEYHLDGLFTIEQQQGLTWDLFSRMGICQVLLSGVEADDVVAILSRAAQRSIIYSTDKDFLQLVRPGHSCYRRLSGDDEEQDGRSGRGRVVDDDNFATHCRVYRQRRNGEPPRDLYVSHPHVFRLALAAAGDSSDNVPGIRGTGWSSAVEFFEYLYRLRPHDLRPEKTNLDLVYEQARCSDSRRVRRIADDWEDYLTCLSVVDLWRDDLLSDAQVSELRGHLDAHRPVYNRERVIDFLVGWEFEDALEWESATHSAMTSRRLDLRSDDMEFRS